MAEQPSEKGRPYILVEFAGLDSTESRISLGDVTPPQMVIAGEQLRILGMEGMKHKLHKILAQVAPQIEVARGIVGSKSGRAH